MGLENFSGKKFRKVVPESVPDSVESAQNLLNPILTGPLTSNILTGGSLSGPTLFLKNGYYQPSKKSLLLVWEWKKFLELDSKKNGISHRNGTYIKIFLVKSSILRFKII